MIYYRYTQDDEIALETWHLVSIDFCPRSLVLDLLVCCRVHVTINGPTSDPWAEARVAVIICVSERRPWSDEFDQNVTDQFSYYFLSFPEDEAADIE